jgi:hypothetical protein
MREDSTAKWARRQREARDSDWKRPARVQLGFRRRHDEFTRADGDQFARNSLARSEIARRPRSPLRNGPHASRERGPLWGPSRHAKSAAETDADFRKLIFHEHLQSGRPGSNRRRPAWEAGRAPPAYGVLARIDERRTAGAAALKTPCEIIRGFSFQVNTNNRSC